MEESSDTQSTGQFWRIIGIIPTRGKFLGRIYLIQVVNLSQAQKNTKSRIYPPLSNSGIFEDLYGFPY